MTLIDHGRFILLTFLGSSLLSLLAPGAATWAQSATAIVRQVQTINTSDFFELSDPQDFLDSQGLAFPPGAETLLRHDSSPGGTLVFVRPGTGPDDANPTLEIPETINMAFAGHAKAAGPRGVFGLLFFDSVANELVGVGATSEGALDPAAISRFDAQTMGVQTARGMGFDALSGRLFVLDGERIVQIEAGPLHDFDAALSEGQIETNPLDAVLADAGVQGLAFDPANGRLYTFSPKQQFLYELSQDGQLLSVRDFSPFESIDPRAMVFAPSADRTDDPLRMSLYIASGDDEGRDVSEVTEWALPATATAPMTRGATLRAAQALFAPPRAVTARNVVADLVNTIVGSDFEPPSSDSAGISYSESAGTLLMSDSEVNEIPEFFDGDNLFEVSLSGSLLATTTTTNTTPAEEMSECGAPAAFSDEPTGVAYNAHNDHVFISDDDNDEIYELDPGTDGDYGTADDIVTCFSTREFDSFDPEGLAYDGTDLYVVDGVNSEVYRVSPGPNTIFDGLPSAGGDDVVTAFDTESLGALDPEGIAHDSNNDLLYVASAALDTALVHITKVGTLVRRVDISAAGANNPAGVAFAPSSVNPAQMNVYVTARGIDNDSDTNDSDADENDGRIYEFSVPALPRGNRFPGVAAGPDQTVFLPGDATLDGTVTDADGPQPLTTMWSQVSGPGTVTFADISAVDTTASFSDAGIYVLKLTAEDGLTAASTDEMTVTVLDPLPEIATVYMSATSGGTVAGVAFENEDVLAFDVASETWSLFFDGSAEGLGTRPGIDALHVDTDGSILMSFTADGLIIPDVGSVDDGDIVRFDPGTGAYELFFDGSDVGLEPGVTNDDVDALGFAPDGRLVISTRGTVDLTGRKTQDDDLLIFTGTLGEATSGTFELYFDGQDVGLNETGSEDVFGVWIDDNNDIYLTTVGRFNVSGAVGDASDIVACASGTLGSATTCAFSLFFDGSENEFASKLSGLSLVSGLNATTVVSATAIDAEAAEEDSNAGTVRITRTGDLVGDLTVTYAVTGSATDGVDYRSIGTSAVIADGRTSVDVVVAPIDDPVDEGTAEDVIVTLSAGMTYTVGSPSPATVTIADNDIDVVTFERRVDARSDNAEESPSGSVSLSSSDLELGFEGGGNQTVALRFVEVAVPTGATIVDAYVQFQVDEVSVDPVNLDVAGQATDDAVKFAARRNNVSSRATTAARVSWTPAPWKTVGEADADQRTANIASVIQEIVNRAGWASGNSLAIIITGSGTRERVAESFKGSQAGAPLLHVEYHE